jgi:hypothetical protein
MPTPDQRAGKDWELALARYLRENGHPGAEVADTTSYRRAGQPDLGDIDGLPDWTLDAKSPGTQAGRFDMAAAMDQVLRARARRGTPYAAVVRKRKMHPAARAFVIMELGQWAALMRRLDELEAAATAESAVL